MRVEIGEFLGARAKAVAALLLGAAGELIATGSFDLQTILIAVFIAVGVHEIPNLDPTPRFA